MLPLPQQSQLRFVLSRCSIVAFALAFLGHQVYRWIAGSRPSAVDHFSSAIDILSTLLLYTAIITMLVFLELKRRTRRIERQNFLIFGVFLFLYPVVQDAVTADIRLSLHAAQTLRHHALLLSGFDNVTFKMCLVIGLLSILRYLADILATRWLTTHAGQELVRSINRQFFSR